jgi:hypothetical protein
MPIDIFLIIGYIVARTGLTRMDFYMPAKSLAKTVGETFRDNKLTTRTARHVIVAGDNSKHRKGIYPAEMSHGDKCVRAIHYRLTDVPPAPSPMSIVTERIFDFGNISHGWWQKQWWDMGILKGDFACHGCGLVWEGLSPHECPRCGMGRAFLIYREVPFKSEEYGVVGRADADTTTDGLIEVKTVGVGSIRWEAPHLVQKHGTDWDALWRDIKHPFPSHRKQGMLYCFFLNREKIKFIYDPKFVSAAPKEFDIVFNRDYIEDILQECLEINKRVADNLTPRRPPWAEKNHRTCQRCPFKKTCYSTLNP